MTQEEKPRYARSGRTATDIGDSLRERIASGELAGGQALRQQELADAYGVSKIPIREALRQLEYAGLVTFRPRRGAVVVELDMSDLMDLLDVRRVLECRALALAVPNMVPADFAALKALLADYCATSKARDWSRLNRRFHELLYLPCDRPHLLAFIRDVQQRMGPWRRLRVTQLSGLDRPHAEHLAIVAACEQRRVDEAVALLGEHIEATQREVAAYFRAGPA